MKLLKSKTRQFLQMKSVQSKIRRILNIEGMTRETIYKSLLTENGWIFSQPKSGTTEFCNVLAFYRAIKHDTSDYGFQNLADFGVVRSAHSAFTDVGKSIRYASISGDTVFFQTHDFYDVHANVAIFQTRNIFDQAVSAYFFTYKNKIGKSGVKVDYVLTKIISRYIDTHLLQKKAASKAGTAIALHYEDTRQDPLGTLTKVVKQLDTTFSSTALQLAIEAAAPEKLKLHEKQQGHAAVAPKGSHSVPHFIRSGKVGEGKEFFNDNQIQFITDKCAERGVNIDGRLEFNETKSE